MRFWADIRVAQVCVSSHDRRVIGIVALRESCRRVQSSIELKRIDSAQLQRRLETRSSLSAIGSLRKTASRWRKHLRRCTPSHMDARHCSQPPQNGLSPGLKAHFPPVEPRTSGTPRRQRRCERSARPGKHRSRDDLLAQAAVTDVPERKKA